MYRRVLWRASVPIMRLLVLLVVGVTAAIFVGSDGPALASHTQIFFTPQGRVNPEPIIVFLNGPAQGVDLRVKDVHNSNGLGSFEVTFKFDPGVATATLVQLGPFLGSTGRAVSCTTPTIAPGSVNISCNTLTNTPNGPLGSGVLATVTFQPATIAPPCGFGFSCGLSTLVFNKHHLTDITGDVPLPHTALTGSLRVAKCGDFDGTKAVAIGDILQIIQRFGTFAGGPNWDPKFDLNSSGNVDVGDLLIEVQEFGQRCNAT